MKHAVLACATLFGMAIPAAAQEATKPAAPVQATIPVQPAPLQAVPVQPAPAPAARKGGTMVVNFVGPVTSASMAELVRAAQDAVLIGADEIQINISSVGGRIYAARFATNALKSLPIKVVTVGMSDVSSSAVALFCAGAERHVAPGASIFLHQLTRFTERSPKTAAAQEREDEIVFGWYDSMLFDCLTDPSMMAEIEVYKARDVILDRDDAYRLGMGNAPFAALRDKKMLGRAVNIVPGELRRATSDD